MKTSILIDGKSIEITAYFGEKLGYSPYLVTSSWSPSRIADIKAFFCESTLESAIKRAVRTFTKEIQKGERIALITGDGQIIDLKLDRSPIFDYVPKKDGD